MKLLDNMILTESIEIRSTPEKVFEFFQRIVDDESYRAWHPEDHVALRWIKGEPWQRGSVLYAEEYLHGKLHKLKFLITEVVPNRKIEFAPLSRLLRIFFPKNTFSIEPKEHSCIFTTTGCFRLGRFMKAFAKKKLDFALLSVRKHMKEEAENLKRLLENNESHNQAADATDGASCRR